MGDHHFILFSFLVFFCYLCRQNRHNVIDLDKNKPTLLTLLTHLVESGRIKSSTMSTKALRSLLKTLNADDLPVADLTETMLGTWIDGILPRLSRETVVRYIESISTIYDCALRLGVVADRTLCHNLKHYMANVCSDGLQHIGTAQVDAVRRLANHTFGKTAVGVTIDAHLMMFYNAGVPLTDVAAMRYDSDTLCALPHTDAIKDKYRAPIRRYVFPLLQNQRTLKKVCEKLEHDFTAVLRMHGIDLHGKSTSQFMLNVWVAAAKDCGIPLADIAACVADAAADARIASIQPSALSDEQIADIKLRVANSVADMSRHWYAVRFAGKEDLVRRELEAAANGAYLRIYYPIEEIYKKVGKRRVVDNRPTIRNTLFVQTMPTTVRAIAQQRTEQSRFYIMRNKSSRSNQYAIIPDAEMHSFSVLVSNGLDILGEDELDQTQIIEEGAYVQITEGMFKGYIGHVLRVRTDDNSRVTMLKVAADKFGAEMQNILGKNIYITVPQNIVLAAAPKNGCKSDG